MPRLIWVFAGRTCHLLVLSCSDSFPLIPESFYLSTEYLLLVSLDKPLQKQLRTCKLCPVLKYTTCCTLLNQSSVSFSLKFATKAPVTSYMNMQNFPVSSRTEVFRIENNTVTIRAVSCCIFSKLSFSYVVYPSQTTTAYSKIGRRNVYIWFKVHVYVWQWKNGYLWFNSCVFVTVTVSVHKWHLIRYWVWNKTFCWWLCLLSWN